MKKILFLQNMGDSLGGILSVNKTLADCFNKNGDVCHLISIRNGGYYNKVDVSEFETSEIINKKDEWGIIYGKDIKQKLRELKIKEALKLFVNRIIYDNKLKKDFNITKKKIIELQPDIIINSHYELLNAIPKKYLSKTIMHYHTNFNIVKSNSSCFKTFKIFKNKLGKFIWLTKSTCEEAIKSGITNSDYIYNPVRIDCNKSSDVIKNKSLIFLGRISKEKRVELLLKIFDDITKDKKFNDWKLHLYGIGNYDENSLKIIKNNANIIDHGSTNNVKEAFLKSSINLNTSEFEGFSMTILEGNECSVPTITFEFGETVKEQIINNKTGIIVKQDDVDNYMKSLKKIMEDTKALEKMSKSCKKFSENFKKEIIFKKWLSIVDEIEKGDI